MSYLPAPQEYVGGHLDCFFSEIGFGQLSHVLLGSRYLEIQLYKIVDYLSLIFGLLWGTVAG